MTNSWTDEEIENLKKGILPLGRSANAIKCKLQRLGFVAFKKPAWTDENRQKLRELIAQGKKTKEIAEILVYTVHSIQREAARLNILPNRQVRFTTKETLLLHRFLKQNFQQKTSRELAEIWNSSGQRKITDKKVVNNLKLLGLKVSHSEMIKLSWLRRREQQWIKEKDFDSIRKRRIALMTARYEKKQNIWSALPSTEVDLDFKG